MTAYVCHPEERRILPLNLRTKILRKRSLAWLHMFVILRNEGSCPLVYRLRFFAKEAQHDCACLSSWGTKDLVLESMDQDSSQKKLRMTVYVCHPEERRILPFWPWAEILRKTSSEWQSMSVILRNEGSCPLVYRLRFFAKEAQNDSGCWSSWGTKVLVLFGHVLRFFAKETQNVRVCLSSWGTKDLAL